MDLNRWTRLVFTITASFIVIACFTGVNAQSPYPNRPIQIIIPFGPGGGVDREARLTASCLSNRYKQPVVAINRPGANSLIGANAVKNTAPDGYTLLYSASNMVTDLALGINPEFDVRRDLEPITKLLVGIPGIFINAGVPAQTMADLIAYARVNPGKLNYGTTGIGSINHLGTEALAMTAGIELVHVPYNNGAGAFYSALMTGEIQVVLAEVSTGDAAVETGRVRLLAVMSQKRMSSRPSVPSLLESLPGAAPYLGLLWHGYFAPLHTPKEIVERNYKELRSCVTDEVARIQFHKMGYEDSQLMAIPPDEFKTSIVEDVGRVSELVKKVHISLQ